MTVPSRWSWQEERISYMVRPAGRGWHPHRKGIEEGTQATPPIVRRMTTGSARDYIMMVAVGTLVLFGWSGGGRMSESAAGTQRFDPIGAIGLVGLLALVLGAFLIGEFEVSDVTGSDAPIRRSPSRWSVCPFSRWSCSASRGLPENVDVGIYIRWATLAIASVPSS